MRPASIRLFDKVFFASLALGIINTLLSWRLVASAADDPALRASGMGEGVIVTGLALGIALPVLLWYFVARRASNIAKWLYVVLTAFGLLGLVQALANPLVPKGATLLLSALAVVLQIYAAWLLFRPDARAWLDGEDEADGADTLGEGPLD
jgi:uncharacterized membrane protein